MSSYIYESNDYEKVKRKFEFSSKLGYKHIKYWIVSIGFYEDYLIDNSKLDIKRVTLNHHSSNDFHECFLGYEIIVSNMFDAKYGVSPVFIDDNHD